MSTNAESAQSGAMQRKPLRFAIIGAGMSGILSGIKLKEAGYDDYVIYEKADRLGGTWRENTYAGVACDVPSHLYSYDFAPNPNWSHRFSPGAEIQAYFEKVASDYGVEKRIRFDEEVTQCEFKDGRWHLRTSKGSSDEVDFVIAATGVLHHPNMPLIEGLDQFEGDCFHTARWDHSIPLAGRRVGVIGTGSTAIQITGALADQVEHFTLFQRTPQWIMPQDNPAYTESEQKEFRKHPEIMKQLRDGIAELFADNFSNAVVDSSSPLLDQIQETCRQNLEDSVSDPELREKLRPNYRAGCKRLIMSDLFYQALQLPNAELVTDGIERIEPNGVRTSDGRLHELDVLVIATGFRVDRFMRPMDVVGRDGLRLEDAWADRPAAYLSVTIPDFPNFYMLNGPNGPVGNFSLIDVAALQLGYILQLVEKVASGECSEISAQAVALREFEEQRVKAAANTVWVTGCNSWYLDDRGIPAVWPWTFHRFRERMASPDWSAYEMVG
jgi:cation diffusion facilitator CzcD-associated flavoprotein CzcO